MFYWTREFRSWHLLSIIKALFSNILNKLTKPSSHCTLTPLLQTCWLRWSVREILWYDDKCRCSSTWSACNWSQSSKNRVSGSLFSTLISHHSPVKDLSFIHNTQTNNQKKHCWPLSLKTQAIVKRTQTCPWNWDTDFSAIKGKPASSSNSHLWPEDARN